MFKRLRYKIMLAILLISALNAGAQMVPDYVHIGATKNYWVDSIAGSNSKYIWKIDGVEQRNGPINLLKYKWDTPGKFTISVQEFSGDGCPGTAQTGEVYVYQITPPGDLIECVENIQNAYYDAIKQEVIIDRPDYFIFKQEDKLLDLKPFNFTDFFPSTCPVEIRWKIERDDGTQLIPVLPNLYQTGQPSTYGNILLPGDGINFNPVVYKITYWIVDCNGYVSYTNTQTITINPRPFIKDNY